MKDVLEVYGRPLTPSRITVCFDERSVQLLADSRPAQLTRPGVARRVDYEYVRRGTCNVFLFVLPQVGQRHVVVTQRRTKLDFAYAMRYLTHHLCPTPDTIDLVLDHLNTHTADAVIEIFGLPEAAPIVSRLYFHYTPLHASWMNMAECELSVMTRQALDRRLPDAWMLYTELIAWERRRNANAVPLRWSFAWKRAKRLFDPDDKLCPPADATQN